jgi:hypothetical protein
MRIIGKIDQSQSTQTPEQSFDLERRAYLGQTQPGEYETSPLEQKLIENATTASAGMALPMLPQVVMSIPKTIKTIGRVIGKIPEAIQDIKSAIQMPGKIGRVIGNIKALPTELEGIPSAPITAPEVPIKSPIDLSIGTKTINKRVPRPIPEVEVYLKGKMGGGISPNTGKKLPEVPIYGVKGDPAKLQELFGDPNPASVPADILKAKGFALPTKKGLSKTVLQPTIVARPAPKQIDLFKYKPSEPIQLPTEPQPSTPIVMPTKELKTIERAAEEEMLLPIQPPKPKSQFLEGGEARVAEFKKATAKDIDAYNPITSRYEINKQLGPLEKAAREQIQAGAKAETMGEERAKTTLDELYKQYKFKPGSPESAAVKVYGESPNKLIASSQLELELGPEKARKIIAAESFMASKYKDYLAKLKEAGLNIRERQDYHNHINELNLLNDFGLLNKADTPAATDLVKRVLTDSQQAQASKFSRVLDIPFRHIRRKGLENVDDAVQGFERYTKEAENYIAMQPYIKELQASADAVKESMPNLSVYLRNQADSIAGKKTALDSALQNLVGPEAFKGFVELTNRMKGNILQANPNVAYSQLFAEPVIAGSVPVQDYLTGAVKAMANPTFREFMYQNSPVMQKRMIDAADRARYSGKLVKALDSVTTFLDTNIVGHAWAAKFNELVRQGIPTQEAISKAEEFAAMTQGFLSKTNTPEMLRSQTFQSLAPFMNQVLAQSRYVVRDMFKGKSLTGKTAAATKLLATGSAIGIVGQLLLGERSEPPGVTEYIPMGPALERGLGGPVIGSAGRILKAKDTESRIMETIKAVLLAQKKIPAGLMIGRGIEKLFKEGQ